MKKYFNWLLTSNRMKHLYAGAVLLVLWILLGAAMHLSGTQIAVTGLIMVLIAMCTAEYKDKAHGGAWDWLDILAGIIIPLLICLVILLVE